MTPRARFFLLLLPRLLVGRCGPGRLAGYAVSLTESGNERLAKWCWNRAIRGSLDDAYACPAVLDACVRTGKHETAAGLASRYFDRYGVEPAEAARLSGHFALAGAYERALEVLERLLRRGGDDLMSLSPAPEPPSPLDGAILQEMLEARIRNYTTEPIDDARLHLHLARLCFSVCAFDTSLQLFERAGESALAEPRDRIAYAYAAVQNGLPDPPGDVEALGTSPTAASVGADWHMLLATVLFARGAFEAASAAVESALRERFVGHPAMDELLADGRAVVASLAACPETLTLTDTGESRAARSPHEGAVRKIFVGGYGWSGSGALYDALTEYGGLAEAPDNPIDQYINACTGNEMTFAQGPAGLGSLWRVAKQTRRLPRLQLWDLFRWHVVGGGAIGYSEHKSARTAASLATGLGAAYTGVFRRAFERIASLSAEAPLNELAGILRDATESLTRALTGARGNDWVILNNAIFGPNIDMLEIFSNFRAAIVARDPLDQFADRRAQDLKQWMSPHRFVPFYRGSRLTFRKRRRQLQSQLAKEVREIAFEQFVLDATYRQDILDWLLEGRAARRSNQRRFDPARSSENIGIHAMLLTAEERKILESGLSSWRTNRKLAPSHRQPSA